MGGVRGPDGSHSSTSSRGLISVSQLHILGKWLPSARCRDGQWNSRHYVRVLDSGRGEAEEDQTSPIPPPKSAPIEQPSAKSHKTLCSHLTGQKSVTGLHLASEAREHFFFFFTSDVCVSKVFVAYYWNQKIISGSNMI